jgi:putative addiction module killer protein
MKILHTQEFIDNIKSVKDRKLSAIVTARLARVADGNFGDSKSVGNGISELRIHYNQGFRIYFCQRGKEIIFLLCAGDKSDQKKDIKKAQELAKGV